MRLSPLLRLLFAATLFALPLSAQTWKEPARELVEKALAKAQSRTALALTVRNSSSLTPAQVAEVRRELEKQFHEAGARLAPADRAVEEVRVTLAENARGHLWTAEVGSGDSWEVVMVTAPPLMAALSPAPPALTLRRTLLWSQAVQILDAALTEPANLLVLEPGAVAHYRLHDGRWEPQGSAPLPPSQPLPRDLRGRLLARTDGGFTAWVPGVECEGALQPQLRATCRESDAGWPLSFGSRAVFARGRNYFTGELVPALKPGSKLPPFYSAAAIEQQGAAMWLFAGLDGNIRLAGPSGDTVASFGGAGSDLAAVQSDCGSGWQVLATRPGENTRTDAVQAYEVQNQEPVEAAPALEFAGPVTALWPSADNHSATAVAHNLKTGHYEAFTLTVVCGR